MNDCNSGAHNASRGGCGHTHARLQWYVTALAVVYQGVNAIVCVCVCMCVNVLLN